jgi:LacI family transcriptional regulator
VTGDLSTFDHAEKLNGFRQSLQSMKSPLQLVSVAEAHDEPSEAYRLTRECLRLHPDLAAVYVSTANGPPVLQALKEAGLPHHPAVITTDLMPPLVPLIRSGEVLGTVYQRPRAQGRMAFQAIYQFLVEGICPPVRHRLPPHIVLRSNLDLFLEMLPGDLEEAVSALDADARKPVKRKPRT